MATLNWNLTELFKNHTSFYESIENVKRMLLDIKEYETKEIDTGCLLLEILEKKWIIKELVNNILVYGSLCIELKNKAESLHSEATTSLKFIDLKIIAIYLFRRI